MGTHGRSFRQWKRPIAIGTVAAPAATAAAGAAVVGTLSSSEASQFRLLADRSSIIIYGYHHSPRRNTGKFPDVKSLLVCVRALNFNMDTRYVTTILILLSQCLKR